MKRRKPPSTQPGWDRFDVALVDNRSQRFLANTLARAEERSQENLKKQWRRLYKRTESWVRHLGLNCRVARIHSVRFPDSDIRIHPTTLYTWGDGIQLTGSEILQLMNRTRITFLSPYMRQRDADNHDGDAHLMAVSGPVYVLADDHGKALSKDRPLLCVSVAGLNLASSLEDRTRFLRSTPRGMVINRLGVQRIRLIWHHALVLFQEASVEFPVLCAIGAAEDTIDVANTYATALVDQLSRCSYGTRAVCVSLPDPDDYRSFRAVLRRRRIQLKTTVLLTTVHSMVGLAREFSVAGRSTGILNPSDAQAIRQGSLGMHWRGHRVAMQELLAVQTTLLLQHIDVNFTAWGKRAHAIWCGTRKRKISSALHPHHRITRSVSRGTGED